MLGGIGDKWYMSGFSRSISLPDLAEYVNNAPIILRLTFNDNVLLSFLMETVIVISLKLINQHRFTES